MTDPTAERADRIVRAAEAVLAGSGEVRVKDVAARAGVSLAALYAVFPTKDLLILQMGVTRMKRGLDMMMNGPPVPGSTPGERLAAFLLRYFKAAQREPSVARALTMLDPLGSATDSSDEIIRARAEIGALIRQMAMIAAFADVPEPGDHVEHLVTNALSTLHLGCITWLSGVVSAVEVRRSIALGALLVDIPGSSARTLVARAEKLCDPLTS